MISIDNAYICLHLYSFCLGGIRVESYQQGYNGVISSCEKASEWMVALDLLGEMSAVRIQQSVITYSAAVSACEKGCLCQSSQLVMFQLGGKLELSWGCLRELDVRCFHFWTFKICICWFCDR